jgi:hypothetical protein
MLPVKPEIVLGGAGTCTPVLPTPVVCGPVNQFWLSLLALVVVVEASTSFRLASMRCSRCFGRCWKELVQGLVC